MKNIAHDLLDKGSEFAEKISHQHEIINLNSDSSVAFYNALSTPIKFNHKLSQALELHDQTVLSK